MAAAVGGRLAPAPCMLYKIQQHNRLINALNQQLRWTKSVDSLPRNRWMVIRSLSHSASPSKYSQCLNCGFNEWPCSTTVFSDRLPHPFSRLNHRRSLWSCSVLHRAPHVFEPGSLPSNQPLVDPAKLVEDDVRQLFIDIRKELHAENAELRHLSHYYLDGKGKAIRPLILVLMARAINFHVQGIDGYLSQKQRNLAMIVEMLHTATLVHDDVVDGADKRRGKPSVNTLWDQKKTILGGDFMVAVLTGLLVHLESHEVVHCITEVIHDMVVGELMQLGSKDDEDERFKHYLTKTFKKTASLLAFGCKSVAILGGADETLQETAFQFGRNVGIAFQLVDDLLDFVSNSELLGKPAAADLKLGLATAPVLFACEKFPELNQMITRRFSKPGDVEAALKAVMQSDGLEQTRFLADQHSREAIRCLEQLASSPERNGLFIISDKILNRNK